MLMQDKFFVRCLMMQDINSKYSLFNSLIYLIDNIADTYHE